MKSLLCFVVILSVYTLSLSQSVYQKCVDECIRAGGSPAACYNENCNPADTLKDVQQGQGNPLYLFSYKLMGPAPVIDGSLMSRDGNPSTSDAMDEWKDACSRTLVLNDGGVAQLFLVNSADTLYVGITYEHNNNSDGSGVRLLFDEGNNVLPSQQDGSGDLVLSAPAGIANEQGCAIYKSGGGVLLQDLCFNGTSWINDGDGQTNVRGAKAYFNSDNKVHHNEFAIPLHNGKSDGAANSDLNVAYNDVLGFYLEVIKMGAGSGTWHWAETNGNALKPDTFPCWAKIQLSVERDYFTFYTGRGTGVSPVIDGSITEPAWNGAYTRELMLSNFHYGALKTKIWCLEDSAQNKIFIGVRVYDHTHNSLDACQIFLEETGENSTAMERDYDLDNNAENSLKIMNNNQFSDLFWNMDQGWVADPEAADSQHASAGAHGDFADYEFKIDRVGGQYDVDIPQGGLLGFVLRYHDGDKTDLALADFYWEYTTNNDAQLLDQQGHPFVYIATGWTNLQLGGPFMQIVRPASGGTIHGVVPVEVFSGIDSLTSVICFLSSDTSAKTALHYQGIGTWTGSIDATNAPVGTMLIIRAVSVSGIVTERMINNVEPPDFVVMPLQDNRMSRALTVTRSRAGIDFSVTLKRAGSYSMEMYTMSGKKIWDFHHGFAGAGEHRTRWNTTIGKGVYFILLRADGRLVSERFSVVN